MVPLVLDGWAVCSYSNDFNTALTGASSAVCVEEDSCWVVQCGICPQFTLLLQQEGTANNHQIMGIQWYAGRSEI